MEPIHNPRMQELATIACCECGLPIKSNPANMCVTCLRTRFDITESIPKQVTLHFCRGCERYLRPPSEWIHCALESADLLSLCLNRLKGMNRVKLIDASFLWTEPHSKRIKVKLRVHGEVFQGTILEQVFVVEYNVNHQMCDDCHRSEAKDFWRSMVQVRQKAENKKTFFYLEQLILKHKADENTLGMKSLNDGMDFYYANEAHARKMVEFLVSVLPCKSQHSKKLISHDIHSNIYNYKFTYCIEIAPVSKDSLVCLPKKVSQQFGGISQLCMVYRVTDKLHLIDPTTAQIAEINGLNYWRTPFQSVFNPKQLVEFIVMDIDLIKSQEMVKFPGQGAISQRHFLANVWIVKASELGLTQNTIHTRTHLGHILKIGDSVLGYNIEDSNVNDTHFNQLKREKIPDVILVKKYFPERAHHRNRPWKLKHLNQELTSVNVESKYYNEFLDDLDEDPDLRQNINIFRDKSKSIPVDEHDEGGQFGVTLEEMLEDLDIEDAEMDEN